ncbi:MAG: uroporphyrinogen decarboxylase family protein [Longimicrobiales bacterium]|nr:uroporphyrinogen decarboxylase family protein [Longimicrobiales bacterium]
MTSRERVRVAMELGVPDRVPVFCQLAIGHYFLNASPSPFDIWFRSEGFADALVELQRRYGFDGILVNLPGRDPDIGAHIERIEEGARESVVRWKDGSFTRVPRDDNPHWFGAGGSRVLPAFDDVDPEDLWYVEPWDVTGISCPCRWGFEVEARPPGDFFPPYHLDTIRAVLERTRGEVSVHSEVFSPFSQFLDLVGYEHALLALMDDPGKVRACLEQLTGGAVELACRQAEAGVDAVLISSAFAGDGFISPRHYEEFVLPYEGSLVASVRKRAPGVKVYTHTCGGIGDRLELMLETGTQGIDTLDPPPLGTVELEDAVRVLKGRAFIKGNIDPVNTLLLGGEREVRDAVLHRLSVAGPGGGYILSSACSVAPGVKPEHLELMTRLAVEYGRYG